MTDRFVGTHPNPVAEGGTLNIVYVNSSLANTTVVIEVDNGEGEPPIWVEVTLNSSGEGSVAFHVPEGWIGIALNGPSSVEHTVVVS